MGRVTNTTSEDNMPYIAMVLFDKSGNPIGVASTCLTSSLAVGATTTFEMSPYDLPRSLTASEIASYKAYAFDYQYQW